jgi:hypothetical protein
LYQPLSSPVTDTDIPLEAVPRMEPEVEAALRTLTSESFTFPEAFISPEAEKPLRYSAHTYPDDPL